MGQVFSTEEKELLRLLSLALGGADREGTPADGQWDWNTFFQLSEHYMVLSLLYDVLQQYELPEALKKDLNEFSRQMMTQSYRLFMVGEKIVHCLEEKDIPVCVLKGVTIAQYYPVPEMRKSSDFDLLLLNKEDLGRTVEILKGGNCRLEEEQPANHHQVWRSPEGVALELHTELVEDFDNHRTNECVKRQVGQMQDEVMRVEYLGKSIPALKEGYQAYHLLLHMLQHFLRSGFGIRLLCDWVVFWNRPVEEAEIDKYMQLAGEAGLLGFSDMVTSLCARHLGLSGNPAGIFCSDGNFVYGSGQQKHFGTLVDADSCENFMRDILTYREIGPQDTRRMVVLRGGGFFDYVREFHHQMHLNFPRAGKVFLFWPVLWVITLVRFLHNNRKLQRGAAADILKTAQNRGQLIKKMHLFEERS